MDKKLFSHLILGFGLLLSLLPIKAWADFTIEFTDGHQVTVGRYVDEGQTIKIYTPQGTIGFRKADVKRITEVDANQSASRRLETVTNRSSSPTQASVQDPSEGKETAEASGKTNEPGQEKAAAEGGATEAEREHVNEQYQDVDQQIDAAWKKHVSDMDSGASEEVLTEDRQRLDELNQERHNLIKAARQASPDDPPGWAH